MEEVVPYSKLGAYIPQTSPLLMVDRLSLDPETGKAAGVKAVSMNEPYFQGHFPDNPIMPGVLQVSAISQVGSALLMRMKQADLSEYMPVIRSLRNMKFRTPVTPGDFMVVQAEQDDAQEELFHAKVEVNGTTACQGDLELSLQPRTELQYVSRGVEYASPTMASFEDQDQQKDINSIMQAIPHRYPFLLIDRILHMDQENNRIVGLKNVTGGEPLFQGTPEPTLPPFIQCEIAAQAGCAFALTQEQNDKKLVYFMSISEAHFYHPVVPGDQLQVDMKISARGRYGRADGNLSVGSQNTSSVSMKFAIIDQEQ